MSNYLYCSSINENLTLIRFFFQIAGHNKKIEWTAVFTSDFFRGTYRKNDRERNLFNQLVIGRHLLCEFYLSSLEIQIIYPIMIKYCWSLWIYNKSEGCAEDFYEEYQSSTPKVSPIFIIFLRSATRNLSTNVLTSF